VSEDDEPRVDESEEANGDDAPRIDVTSALGTAGHEVEDLGFEGIEDSAPVLHDDSDEEDPVDFGHHASSDVATRGQGHP